jgi:hypothetical protein
VGTVELTVKNVGTVELNVKNAGWRRGLTARGARGGSGGARGGGGAGCAGWQQRGARWWRGKRTLAAGGGRELVRRGKGEEERRAGLGNLGFWVKFDGVHVAHVFKLRTCVPTFLIC